MNHKDWDLVNRRTVAKMLSELEYEQVFHAESQGDDRYCINLPGAQWRFIAERGIWGWLWLMLKLCAARTGQYWLRRC